jgi:predicted nucleotidyltransferase
MTFDRLQADQRTAILSLARLHGASNVRVFRYVARGDNTPSSDIDFLVDLDIRDCCERVLEYSQPPNGDWMANKLGAEFRAAHPEIPWRRMIDARNILIHAYDSVSPACSRTLSRTMFRICCAVADPRTGGYGGLAIDIAGQSQARSR